MAIKIQLLLFLIARVTICIFAKEAAAAPAEQEELVTALLGASEGPDYSEVPTRELMTTDSMLSSSNLGENTMDAELPTTSEDNALVTLCMTPPCHVLCLVLAVLNCSSTHVVLLLFGQEIGVPLVHNQDALLPPGHPALREFQTPKGTTKRLQVWPLTPLQSLLA
ncbi:hypothetical protein E2320_006388 [Naja naja]|nr:hypothetical protein E2320_006388 [Naja naja]